MNWFKARDAKRRARILAVFDRYPGQRLYGGDVARMAYASLVDVWQLEADNLLASDWGPDPTKEGRRRIYWRTEIPIRGTLLRPGRELDRGDR